ncbi:hypothetical protein [Enterococcus innesii]|uniref:hypothetical protein n=1 Tax=Enterococcus innesii TaxID=2839759 RepID=UPI0034A28677
MRKLTVFLGLFLAAFLLGNILQLFAVGTAIHYLKLLISAIIIYQMNRILAFVLEGRDYYAR